MRRLRKSADIRQHLSTDLLERIFVADDLEEKSMDSIKIQRIQQQRNDGELLLKDIFTNKDKMMSTIGPIRIELLQQRLIERQGQNRIVEVESDVITDDVRFFK